MKKVLLLIALIALLVGCIESDSGGGSSAGGSGHQGDASSDGEDSSGSSGGDDQPDLELGPIAMVRGVEYEVESGSVITPEGETVPVVEVRHDLDSDRRYVTLVSGEALLE